MTKDHGDGRGLTIEQRLSTLTPHQRTLLKNVGIARRTWANAAPNYALAISRAHEAGISYGMMGEALLVPKEHLWRHEQRYSDADGGMVSHRKRQRQDRH